MSEILTQKIRAVSSSVTLEITALANKLRGEGKDVVSFAAGEPDFATPDHICEAAHQAIRDGKTRYTPATGIPALKAAVRDKFLTDNKIDYPTSQIVISCGAKHSIYSALQVMCSEGDEVVIIAPYWVSYPEMIKLAGATPVIVMTDSTAGWSPTIEQIEAACTPKTKAIILNSPSNPAGAVYSKTLLQKIYQLAVECDSMVISDEIYEKIYFTDEPYYSLAASAADATERVITINGPSKSYAMTGWRIGYLAGPAEVTGAIGKLQSHSTSNPSSIAQWAALASLTGDQSGVREACAIFRQRRDYAVERIEAINGISTTTPLGAFYLFVDITATGLGSLDFCKQLLHDELVAAIPGLPFGYDSHIRLSFATSQEQIATGLDRISRFVTKHTA